jgi:hypothetical protein
LKSYLTGTLSLQVAEEGDAPYRRSSRLAALAESSAQGAMRSPSPDEPDEPDPPWWRYAVRPLLEVLHEPHVDVGDEPLPEMEIGEPDPAFLDSQDIDENDMLECRDSSCQDHDEDSGDDDYGEEEERLTLEDMLCAPEMFHNVDNFHMGPEPHQ